jgi:hypothetical protein
MTNKKSRKVDKFWDNVVHAGESDMRNVPALQAADLFAWAENDSHRRRMLRPWQERLLVDVDRERYFYDYEKLIGEVFHDVIAMANSWRLPKRGKPK